LLFGILLEGVRIQTKKDKDKFIALIQKEFNLPSLKVEIDEKFTTAPQFLRKSPPKIKNIFYSYLSKLPFEVFTGDGGLARIAEFEEAQKVGHDKIKGIRLLCQADLPEGHYTLELTDGTKSIAQAKKTLRDFEIVWIFFLNSVFL